MIINKYRNLVSSEVCLITKSYYDFDIICWVDHYLNWCGFDHITIYDNETSCCNISECFKNNDKVTVYKISDEEMVNTKQIDLYVKHLKNCHYNWVLICDDDEYLWFNKLKYKTINDFFGILQTKNIDCFIIPWLMASYEANKAPYTRTQNMKYDCSYIQYNKTDNIVGAYKPCIKINSNDIEFYTTHFIRTRNNYYNFKNYYNSKDLHNISTVIPVITYSIDSADIILMHYHIRSIEEWFIKMERRRIDLIGTTKFKEFPSCYGDDGNKYDNSSYLNYFNPFQMIL